jgi:hypothetical protein
LKQSTGAGQLLFGGIVATIVQSSVSGFFSNNGAEGGIIPIKWEKFSKKVWVFPFLIIL